MHSTPEVVLNVNDSEPARYVTTRILSHAGFKVIEASTGAEALRIAEEVLPGVVVLDINLPDINGIEVCRRLKASDKTHSVLVLQISATNIGVADRVQSLSAGADSFLVEPVHPEELEAVTRALLRLHQSEQALRTALTERDMLLKEVNHRVKNSLQLVLSLLSLQSQEFTNAEARAVFNQAITRISAIASVHERLYQENDPVTVDMQTYVTGLCAELERAGSGDLRAATVQAQVDAIRMPTENGISVALIVNELVMNALKHGRPAQGPSIIQVRLTREEPDQLHLTVQDNGTGPSSAQKSSSGLGARLIQMLVRQLKGRLEIENSPEGYSAHVYFPMQAALTWGPQS
jgi:two-component sensor histidine kinase